MPEGCANHCLTSHLEQTEILLAFDEEIGTAVIVVWQPGEDAESQDAGVYFLTGKGASALSHPN